LVRVLLAVALLGAAFANVARVAVVHACSCATNDQSVQYNVATRVFLGTVVDVIPPVPPDGPGYVTVHFQVTRVWKGPVEPRVVVQTAAQGAACGIQLVTGTKYVVYTNGDPDFSQTGLCSGTYAVTGVDPVIDSLGPGTQTFVPVLAPEDPPPEARSDWWLLALGSAGGVIIVAVAGTAAVQRVRRGR
jgi:hypothetical protein